MIDLVFGAKVGDSIAASMARRGADYCATKRALYFDASLVLAVSVACSIAFLEGTLRGVLINVELPLLALCLFKVRQLTDALAQTKSTDRAFDARVTIESALHRQN